MNDTSTTSTTSAPPPSPHEPPTQVAPEPPGGSEGWRTLTEARRSTRDRLLGGVCGGVGRHLGIDPVIIRVALVALSLVGFAGLLLYLIAWFLLPTDEGRPSVAAEWFNLGVRESAARRTGLIVGAGIAVLAMLGNARWFAAEGIWIMVALGAPILFLYWLFAVLPRRRRTDGVEHYPPTSYQPAPPPAPQQLAPLPPLPPKRRMAPPLLLIATVSSIIIAWGVLGTIDAGSDVRWTLYPQIALALTGLGLIIGAFRGRSYALVPLGLLLSLIVALTWGLPDSRADDIRLRPTTTAAVETSYELGVGYFELDLTGVRDAQSLIGRTIDVDTGIGGTRIVVPAGLPVEVDSHLGLGDSTVLNRFRSGADIDLDADTGDPQALRIVVHHRIGDLEVTQP